jgi:hypothetical protein
VTDSLPRIADFLDLREGDLIALDRDRGGPTWLYVLPNASGYFLYGGSERHDVSSGQVVGWPLRGKIAAASLGRPRSRLRGVDASRIAEDWALLEDRLRRSSDPGPAVLAVGVPIDHCERSWRALPVGTLVELEGSPGYIYVAEQGPRWCHDGVLAGPATPWAGSRRGPRIAALGLADDCAVRAEAARRADALLPPRESPGAVARGSAILPEDWEGLPPGSVVATDSSDTTGLRVKKADGSWVWTYQPVADGGRSSTSPPWNYLGETPELLRRKGVRGTYVGSVEIGLAGPSFDAVLAALGFEPALAARGAAASGCAIRDLPDLAGGDLLRVSYGGADRYLYLPSSGKGWWVENAHQRWLASDRGLSWPLWGEEGSVRVREISRLSGIGLSDLRDWPALVRRLQGSTLSAPSRDVAPLVLRGEGVLPPRGAAYLDRVGDLLLVWPNGGFGYAKRMEPPPSGARSPNTVEKWGPLELVALGLSEAELLAIARSGSYGEGQRIAAAQAQARAAGGRRARELRAERRRGGR